VRVSVSVNSEAEGERKQPRGLDAAYLLTYSAEVFGIDADRRYG
jgi:hypothetical protein